MRFMISKDPRVWGWLAWRESETNVTKGCQPMLEPGHVFRVPGGSNRVGDSMVSKTSQKKASAELVAESVEPDSAKWTRSENQSTKVVMESFPLSQVGAWWSLLHSNPSSDLEIEVFLENLVVCNDCLCVAGKWSRRHNTPFCLNACSSNGNRGNCAMS